MARWEFQTSVSPGTFTAAKFIGAGAATAGVAGSGAGTGSVFGSQEPISEAAALLLGNPGLRPEAMGLIQWQPFSSCSPQEALWRSPAA